MTFASKLNNTVDKWYAIYVRAGKEKDIKTSILKRTDFLEVKDIIIPEPVKAGKNLTLFEEELNERHINFLGYIFIKLILNASKYNTILEMDFIYRFLGSVFCTKKAVFYVPSVIPQKEIDNVKKYLNCTPQSVLKYQSEFKMFQDVMIKRGGLSEIRGKIVELTNSYAIILPSIMLQHPIKVALNNLVACKDSN